MIVALLIWATLIIFMIVYSLSDSAAPARICAWCGKLMGGSLENGRVTHGICSECFDNIRKGKTPTGRTQQGREEKNTP